MIVTIEMFHFLINVVYICLNVKVWEVYFWMTYIEKNPSVWYNLLVYLSVPDTLLCVACCGSVCLLSVCHYLLQCDVIFFL